jgi:phage terminase large subunit-like protein
LAVLTPRVHTPLLKTKSKADEVADLAEKISMPLIPWQRWVLEDLLSIREDGTFVKKTGLILVSRQSGKTHLSSYAYIGSSILMGF